MLDNNIYRQRRFQTDDTTGYETTDIFFYVMLDWDLFDTLGIRWCITVLFGKDPTPHKEVAWKHAVKHIDGSPLYIWGEIWSLKSSDYRSILTASFIFFISRPPNDTENLVKSSETFQLQFEQVNSKYEPI